MAKIVGIDDRHVHRVTCRRCASILEYVNSEVKSFVSHDYGGGSDINYYIKCPKCKDQVTV